MHDSGAIAHFETEADAKKAGYKTPLSKEDLALVSPMNRKQRRQWLKDQRKSGKMKPAPGGSRKKKG